MDIDEQLLRRYQQRAIPLLSDHIVKRSTPLRIEVLCGDMTDYPRNLLDVDVVIALEV